MLYKIAVSITDFFVRRNIIKREEADMHIYGLELMISGLIGIILVMAAGILVQRIWMSAIFLLVIIPIRLFTGGYHADTHVTCNLLFVITYLASVLMFDWLINMIYSRILVFNICIEKGWVWGCSVFFVCIGAVIVSKMAPIRNYNKELSMKQQKQYRKTALILYFMAASISILLRILSQLYFGGISWLEDVGLYINIMLVAIVLLMIIGIGKEESHERKTIKDNC